MIIINSKKTEETGQRLKDFFKDNFKNVVLNVGSSSFIEDPYKNFNIINKTESIKKCINKKEMFKILKKNKINSLEYFNLNKKTDVIKAIAYLILNKKIVLRKNGAYKIVDLKGFFREKNKYSYATLKEKKVLEYRVIMLYDQIIRVMVKINKNNDFILKQNNSKFIDIKPERLEKGFINTCLKAKNSLNIDLCGIDILINEKFKEKIIEINSGMALSNKSIRLIYNQLKTFF